jgi:molybdenum cofactor synthesis domain-containing protein
VSEPTFRASVVTVSDRSAAGTREDRSGPMLAEALRGAGHEVVSTTIVPDEKAQIEAELRRLADIERVSLVVTTGGTGFAPRDVTPEATRAVVEREAPGLAEHARAATLVKTRFAILSRGIAGIRRRTVIVNLPGNPEGARDMLEALLPVLPHALSVLARRGDSHPVS